MTEKQSKFHTVRGYELIDLAGKVLSSSMEDYLEMIYRLASPKGYTRISDLSTALNVQPPSASKMVQKLADLAYLHYQKYGLIELSESGKLLGEYLLYRHEVINNFLFMLGVNKDILEETEKIEHNLSKETVNRINCLLSFWAEHPDIEEKYRKYHQEHFGFFSAKEDTTALECNDKNFLPAQKDEKFHESQTWKK